MAHRAAVRTALVCVVAVLCAASAAAAQTAPSDAQPGVGIQGETLAVQPSEGSSRPKVSEVGPATYYLKDKDGKLQAVPGFTFEDFMRLYEQEKEIKRSAAPPRYRFGKAAITGSVAAGRAELRAELRVTTTDANWVRVPLGLAPAVVATPPKYSGKGEHVLEYDAAGGGYVAWLRGPAPGRPANNGEAPATAESASDHVLTFEKLLIPLAATGDEPRLRLALPRSLALAEVQLDLPLADAVPTVSEGAAVIATRAKGKATEATLTARGGDFEVSWRAADRPAEAAAQALDATSAMRVTIDARAVTWDVQLTVRSPGKAVDSFDVRLPAGARLEPASAGGHTLSVADGTPSVVTVTLRRPAREPVAVHLVARKARDAAAAQESIDLAGFEVVGAARQSGTLVAAADGDWRVVWDEQREVREIDQPAIGMAMADDQQTAAFEFFRQPFSLRATIAPQATRLDVDPQYAITVEPDRVSLEGRLRYQVRGAKVSRLMLSLAGWTLDEIGPPGLVQASGATTGEDGSVTVALAQRMRSSFELTVKAHRKWKSAGEVEFTLPRLAADVIAPPVVVVQAAENVELTPDEAAIEGLVTYVGATTAKTGQHRRTTLTYRATDDGSGSAFAAAARLRQREVSCNIESSLSLDETAVRVEQQLDFRVAHESLGRILLEAPRELLAARDLTLLVDGKEIALSVLAPASGAVASPTVRFALETPLAIAHKGRVTVRFSLPAERAGRRADDRLDVNVPLVAPLDAAAVSNRAMVFAPPGASVTGGNGTGTAQGTWAPANSANRDAPAPALELAAAGNVTSLALAVRLPPRRTNVEVAWIRTLVSGNIRQDRATFRVTTDEPLLRIALPEGARADQLAIWRDGGQVAARAIREADELYAEVDLRAAESAATGRRDGARGRQRVVEVLYNVEEPAAGWGGRRWSPPHVVGPAWETRTYWQVVLPRQEHVVADPEHYTAEYGWGWHPVLRLGENAAVPFWGRRPHLNEAQLQRLTGATVTEPSMTHTNQYLFSTSGPPQAIVLNTMSRSLIVLLCSSVVIVLGIGLIYVRPLRHPAALLTGGVALGAVALWSPPTAVLVGQAALVGLVATLVAAIASWWLGRRASVGPAVMTAPWSERGSGATSHRRRMQERSQATTLTAPAEFGAAAESRS